MGRYSRNKGKVGEREAANELKELWGCPDCRRSVQTNGKLSADLVGGPAGLHLEIKRYATIAPFRWLEQAIRDCPDHNVPVVMCREDKGSWMLMIPLERAVDFSRALVKHLDGLEQQAPVVPDVRIRPGSGYQS